MFYLIGLGLCDELDISIRGLDAVRSASHVYLEAYTSILLVHHDRLQSFYGRPLILADRDLVENHADEILRDAQTENVVFLVVGDPFGATTHTDILLRARALNISTRVIHNASILTAVGATGLQLSSFGQTVSLVFFTDTWKPDSYYDRIAQNSSIGAHSLILLDIKVKEQSDINLARGRKMYEPPRYMDIPTALDQLRYTESIRNKGILAPATILALAVSRLGSGPENNELIVAGTLAELAQLSPDAFGQPLHSLVIVGPRVHPLEIEFAAQFAVNPDSWRNVARTAYKCPL